MVTKEDAMIPDELYVVLISFIMFFMVVLKKFWSYSNFLLG